MAVYEGTGVDGPGCRVASGRVDGIACEGKPMFKRLKKIFGVTPEKIPKTVIPTGQACPYCGAIQDPPPQRKKKCKDCGQPIHVKKRGDGRKHLLTEKEAQELARKQRESQWKELSRHHERETGKPWRKRIEGRNSASVEKEAIRCELRSFQQTRIKKVRVLTSQDERVCQHCQPLEGEIFGVKTALKKMPIPPEHCPNCRCIYTPEF